MKIIKTFEELKLIFDDILINKSKYKILKGIDQVCFYNIIYLDKIENNIITDKYKYLVEIQDFAFRSLFSKEIEIYDNNIQIIKELDDYYLCCK